MAELLKDVGSEVKNEQKKQDLLFVDVEMNPDTGKLINIGAIDERDNKYHGKDRLHFKEFAEEYNMVCGHNFVRHDLRYLKNCIYKKVGKDNKLLFELLSGKSYVYRYTLKNASGIESGGLKTGEKKVYELIANGKVPWKRGGKSKLKKKYKKDGVKNPCAKLEVEGVYIYQGVAYFMTEGVTYCADIKGKFTP